jgi:pSer/pThr/pTyr-binding forkhead associated (FHA) protein
MRIGRRSRTRGLAPEIDLTGPPADPGISRLHAVLVSAPDGGWAVLDPGSANGTLLNGIEIPIGDHIPLRDGDRINLGAWTAITVHRGLGGPMASKEPGLRKFRRGAMYKALAYNGVGP